MMGIFSRRKPATDASGLGTDLIALRLAAGDVAPAPCTVVVFNAGGHARRVAAGKVSCEQGETVFCFHPGPYTVDVAPFAAAPEWGLRLRFVVDAANPRVAQQRFDLYLYSETAGRLALAEFGDAVQLALQGELAQGSLALPPCTTLEEWHAFRAGLNQLMYTRYGVTVDDCVPVDLGDQIEFADVLRARRAAEAEHVRIDDAAPIMSPGAHDARPEAPEDNPSAERVEPVIGMPPGADAVQAPSTAAPAAARPSSGHAAEQDARALRRLFLELPALSAALRMLDLPAGLDIFQQHQAILQRLHMAALNVNTMPSLGWAAPDRPLDAADQSRRAAHSLAAQAALDEAWSLLARLQLASQPQWPQWPQLLDEADRICANLEAGLSQRREPYAARTEPSL